jgi:hypothetical protein
MAGRGVCVPCVAAHSGASACSCDHGATTVIEERMRCGAHARARARMAHAAAGGQGDQVDVCHRPSRIVQQRRVPKKQAPPSRIVHSQQRRAPKTGPLQVELYLVSNAGPQKQAPPSRIVHSQQRRAPKTAPLRCCSQALRVAEPIRRVRLSCTMLMNHETPLMPDDPRREWPVLATEQTAGLAASRHSSHCTHLHETHMRVHGPPLFCSRRRQRPAQCFTYMAPLTCSHLKELRMRHQRVVFQSHAHVSRLAAPHTNTPLAWIGGRLRRPQHGDARDGARRPARTVPRAQDTLCTADTRCSETNSSSAWLSTSALSYRRSWCAAWRTLPRCKLAPQHDSQMEALPSALSQHAR